MISVKKLKKLLAEIPDNAMVYAYEGEDVGIGIELDENRWWIRANEDGKDNYTEGFKDG